ncbi:MAG: hypothetical protein KAG89_02420 [Fulvimarina manganoxydans]|uniref:hypothetical protein n=1 Tax=Fulvimarina manganoxydans TaxID=937218 RepID=UPI0023526A8F|nr:hypothetical protein [Fulvimarina manganoxydans]MCK5930999.1 hypothetical protein [Fulvimarina manganoxydans]
MIRTTDPRQMAFCFDPPKSILAVLVDAGIVRSETELMWQGIPNEIDAPAPSRAYTAPILVYTGRMKPSYGGDGRDHLYRLPAVHVGATTRRVMDLLGSRIEKNRSGAVVDHRPWWHAVDLMSDEWLPHLLTTRHMTEDRCIERAVVISLECGPNRTRGDISLATARAALDAIGSEEPDDRSVDLLLDRRRFGVNYADGWVINPHHAPGTGWAMVHGLEDKWLQRGRDGFLRPAKKLLQARGEVLQ